MTVTSLRKSALTRRRILDAAAKVFRDRGYAGARLSDIAAEAGMQAGSLYYHFGSRFELIEEVLRAGVDHAGRYMRAAVAQLPADASATDRLRAALGAHLRLVIEISDYTAANVRIFGQVPNEVRRRHLLAQRELGAYLAQLLEAAQAAGEIRADLDLSVVRMLIFGALNWAPEWYDPEGRATPTEIADAFWSMISEGLAPRSGNRPSRKM